MRDFPISQPRHGTKVISDPNIDDPDLRADVPRKYVDASPAFEEVQDHLGRDRGRIGTHALFRDAMISGKGENQERA